MKKNKLIVLRLTSIKLKMMYVTQYITKLFVVENHILHVKRDGFALL